METNSKLGSLVEFLNYVVIFSETSKLFTVYSTSYPEIRLEHADETSALHGLKQQLAELSLD
jgi:hypothetical protein